MSEQVPKQRGILERIRSTDFSAKTVILLTLGTAFVILFDILPAMSRTLGDTISERVTLWSLFMSAIPAGCGILMGHLFGPQFFRTPGWVTLCLLAYGVGLIVCSALGYGQPRHHWVVTLVFWFHFCVGALGWSQGSMIERLPELYQWWVVYFNGARQ